MRALEIRYAYAVNLPKGLTRSDGFDFDLDYGYEAAEPDDVDFFLTIGIGAAGHDWDEVFTVGVVTTNNRLRNNPNDRFILLPVYSFLGLKHELHKVLRTCERNSFEECLDELRRRFRWEYD